MDRDLNAATNILLAGGPETGRNICEGIRLGEKGPPRKVANAIEAEVTEENNLSVQVQVILRLSTDVFGPL